MGQKIPKGLLYADNLSRAYYGYPCFDCNPSDDCNQYKFVIGFSEDPPRGSTRSQFLKNMAAIVYRCPLCGRIFWLHCKGKEIRAYQRYKKKMAELGAK